MRIRIANKGINHSQTATTLDEASASYGPMWVEIDGHRTYAVIGSRVEQDGSSDGGNFAVVTLTFAAAVEMVIVDANGDIMTEPTA